ncbi:hypothetical protein FR483_n275R [Paramecium bursaria Chlorella virus FR483]|uniref:Uncharacterized protein n275R n=1 Tax=Paramecium bursaria Chlorella virus FR483 TaxID=399781 RepID=A7J6X9_PBCVF|nr:hypothetical protein FR483_n275R [Paramecium bursaria Chlorella virus FR483]ABT15560.1 hypothetical protein FR483_n275R [Paramecium bursaria Chlorella virus FR483]
MKLCLTSSWLFLARNSLQGLLSLQLLSWLVYRMKGSRYFLLILWQSWSFSLNFSSTEISAGLLLKTHPERQWQ